MSFNCTCPYCKQLLQCEDAWAGMTAQCPTCGQNIVMNPPPPPIQFNSFAGTRPERASGGKILSVYLFMPFLLLFSPLSLILLIYLVVKGSWKNVKGHALASFLIWFLLIPAIGILLAVLAVPAVNRARAISRTLNCVNTLKEIDLGILMYAEDHDGHLPRSLNDLSKYVNPQISATCRCPDGGEYRYLGNGQSIDYRDDASSTIVVICTSDHGPHGDWANAAFLDGHVETLPKRSLEDAVKKRKKGALPVLRQ